MRMDSNGKLAHLDLRLRTLGVATVKVPAEVAKMYDGFPDVPELGFHVPPRLKKILNKSFFIRTTIRLYLRDNFKELENFIIHELQELAARDNITLPPERFEKVRADLNQHRVVARKFLRLIANKYNKRHQVS
jgi:hypothetical protein